MHFLVCKILKVNHKKNSLDIRYINLITESMMKKLESMAKKGQPFETRF